MKRITGPRRPLPDFSLRERAARDRFYRWEDNLCLVEGLAVTGHLLSSREELTDVPPALTGGEPQTVAVRLFELVVAAPDGSHWLAERLGSLSGTDRMGVVDALARKLAAAHKQGLACTNVALDNLVVLPGGRPKDVRFLEFGSLGWGRAQPTPKALAGDVRDFGRLVRQIFAGASLPARAREMVRLCRKKGVGLKDLV